MADRPAKVFLVGAGPGDPGLLTLRGKECLQMADVVIHDYLASRNLLKFARADALIVSVGLAESGRKLTQSEIEARMIAAAQAGKCVVRLKGGDPGIFGRLAEEAAALQSAGIRFEVVPGITTAVSAAPYAGVTATSRRSASCVAFVTGRLGDGAEAVDQIDFAALAKFPGTLVFYMGVNSAANWSSELIGHGMKASTPAVVVRRCSLPDQQSWTTTLRELPALLNTENIDSPLVTIVGDVALQRDIGSWFTERPLFGQTILITRPEQQSAAMARELAEMGAEVLQQPAIEIGPPADVETLRAAISRLDNFEWIVFSSRNGVEYFFAALADFGRDVRALGSIKLAAIGPATGDALAERGLKVDLLPDEYRAEALADALAPQVAEKRVLLVRASRGREVLCEMLTDAGATVEQVVAYQSRDAEQADEHVMSALESGRVAWTTVTSSAIARSIVRLFGERLRNTKLVAISPLTASVLQELGYPPHAVAEEFTAGGIATVLLRQTQK